MVTFIFQSTRPSRASTLLAREWLIWQMHFNPQGPRGPRRFWRRNLAECRRYFNPQGPRGPRPTLPGDIYNGIVFQSTRPSRASTIVYNVHFVKRKFQSTRPSRASTNRRDSHVSDGNISIHKALAGLDISMFMVMLRTGYFNPQGPRGPRLRCRSGF